MDSNENKLLEEGTKKVFEVLSEVNIAHNYFVETNANLLVNIRALWCVELELKKKGTESIPHKSEWEGLSIHRPAWRLKFQYQVLENSSKKRNIRIFLSIKKYEEQNSLPFNTLNNIWIQR